MPNDKQWSSVFLQLSETKQIKISSTAIPDFIDKREEDQQSADDGIEAAKEAFEAEDVLFDLEDYEDENSKTITATEGLVYKKQVVGGCCLKNRSFLVWKKHFERQWRTATVKRSMYVEQWITAYLLFYFSLTISKWCTTQ